MTDVMLPLLYWRHNAYIGKTLPAYPALHQTGSLSLLPNCENRYHTMSIACLFLAILTFDIFARKQFHSLPTPSFSVFFNIYLHKSGR
jgi:hypothetical protein